MAGWRLLVALVLALPFLLPSAATASEGDWEVKDPAGDAGPFGQAAPSGPLGASADLRSVRILNEDEVGFDLVLAVTELNVAPGGATCCVSSLSFDVAFKIGSSPAQYWISAEAEGGPAADASSSFFVVAATARAYLDVCNHHDCTGNGLPVAFDDAANEVRIHVPKDDLLGWGGHDRDSPPAGLPETIRPGDRLSDLHVDSRLDEPGFSAFEDRAPDDGAAPPYVFKAGTANGVVGLSWPERTDAIPVRVGANRSVPFTLTNRADGRRIVQLSYELQGPDDRVRNYHPWGPRTIQLAAGDTRNFTLALRADAAALSGDGVRLVIRGVSLAHPDEVAYASALLEPGMELGPGANVLHFFAMPRPQFGEPVDAAFCSVPHSVLNCRRGFLSPLEEDPNAIAGTIQGSSSPSATGVWHYFDLWLLRPVGTPIAFDPAVPIETTLRLTAPVPGSYLVHASLEWGHEEDRGTVVESSAPAELSPSGTDVVLTGVPELGEAPYLPEGAQLELRVEVSADLSPTADAAFVAGGVEIVPAGSAIKLPLVELPASLRTEASPSAFQLSLKGSPDEFVNPGEARLFNLTVLDQAPEAHDLRLAAAPDRTGWSAEFLPGSVYRLAAGDTVRVGVLVHAPTDAKEGDVALVRVNGTDEAGGVGSVLLRVIATKGVDLPDDAARFHADEDARAKLVAPHAKNTPGPELVLAEGAIMGLGLALRRRRA